MNNHDKLSKVFKRIDEKLEILDKRLEILDIKIQNITGRVKDLEEIYLTEQCGCECENIAIY